MRGKFIHIHLMNTISFIQWISFIWMIYFHECLWIIFLYISFHEFLDKLFFKQRKYFSVVYFNDINMGSEYQAIYHALQHVRITSDGLEMITLALHQVKCPRAYQSLPSCSHASSLAGHGSNCGDRVHRRFLLRIRRIPSCGDRCNNLGT
jgi:hypothetical protein